MLVARQCPPYGCKAGIAGLLYKIAMWLNWHPHRTLVTVKPKHHYFGFCFNATASTHKEFYGLTFAPQTNPASPAVLMRRIPKRNSYVLFDSRDSPTHCPILFSRSTDFSSPLRYFANFVVRVYVSIVAGGSLAMYILVHLNRLCVLLS